VLSLILWRFGKKPVSGGVTAYLDFFIKPPFWAVLPLIGVLAQNSEKARFGRCWRLFFSISGKRPFWAVLQLIWFFHQKTVSGGVIAYWVFASNSLFLKK